jgi:hypothetical protein
MGSSRSSHLPAPRASVRSRSQRSALFAEPLRDDRIDGVDADLPEDIVLLVGIVVTAGPIARLEMAEEEGDRRTGYLRQ